MHCVFLAIYLSLVVTTCSATGLSGPYLFWGHQSVINLQPRALVEVSEEDLTNLFQDTKAIVIFVRNTTGRINGKSYPRFQQLVKSNAWAYLPQHFLNAEPFNYNANIEVCMYVYKCANAIGNIYCECRLHLPTYVDVCLFELERSITYMYVRNEHPSEKSQMLYNLDIYLFHCISNNKNYILPCFF